MATSGEVRWTTSNQYIDAKVSWSLVSQSVENNTSTIDVNIAFTRTNAGYTTTRKWAGSIFCGMAVGANAKSTTSETLTIVNGSWVVAQTMRINLLHNPDGSAGIIVGSQGGTLTGGSTDYNVPAYYLGFDLPTIARATKPTLSASTTEMGKSVIINCPRASSSFTHKLTYYWGSKSGTIASGVGTSYTWYPPIELANEIPNATKGKGTIRCQTYNGSTLIGTNDVTFYATVPSSVVPEISSILVSDPNKILNTYGAFVQNKSRVKVQVGAKGAYESTISSLTISLMGETSNENPYTSGIVNIAGGKGKVTVKVTDSRGRTASRSMEFNVLAYSNPKVNYIKATRCDANGDANEDSGEYIKIQYSGSITSLGNKNEKQFLVQYKESTSSTWGTLISYTDSYSLVGSTIIEANPDKSYDVQMVSQDAFFGTSVSTQVGTAFTLFDVNDSGRGFAFGKVSEEDALEIDLPAKFTGGIYISGRKYGTYIRFSNSTLAPAVSVPSDSSWHPILELDIPFKGIWFMSYNARFASNSTGKRKICLATYDSSSGTYTSQGIIANDYRDAVNGEYTYCNCAFLNEFNAGKYYVIAMQNSGSSLSVTPRLFAYSLG